VELGRRFFAFGLLGVLGWVVGELIRFVLAMVTPLLPWEPVVGIVFMVAIIAPIAGATFAMMWLGWRLGHGGDSS
jgi:hypothetical protein